MKKITTFLKENNGQSPIDVLINNGFTPNDIDKSVDNLEITIEGYEAKLIEQPVKKEKKPAKKIEAKKTQAKKPVKKQDSKKQPEATQASETSKQETKEQEQPKEEIIQENVPNASKSTFEKYSFERLQKLEAKMKKAKPSDRKELERIWNKYITKLRGWVNLTDNGDSTAEWLEHCKKNNLDPDYQAHHLFPMV